MIGIVIALAGDWSLLASHIVIYGWSKLGTWMNVFWIKLKGYSSQGCEAMPAEIISRDLGRMIRVLQIRSLSSLH